MIKDLMMIPAVLRAAMGSNYTDSVSGKHLIKSGMTPKRYGVMLADSKRNRKYRGRRRKAR